MAAGVDNDAITKEIILNIKSLLISRPTVVTANLLQRELEDELGKPVNPLLKPLGFQSFIDYLRSIPTVVQLDFNSSRHNPNVYPVTSSRSKHIDQLVSKQRVAPTKRRGVSRRGPGGYNSRPPPNLRRRPTIRSSSIPDVRPRPSSIPNDRPNRVDRSRPNQGIEVRDLERQLLENYNQADLQRNGINSIDDVLARADNMVERGDTKVYPKLYSNANQTNSVPAGFDDEFDDEYDEDYFFDNEEETGKDSEEEMSNRTIQMWSKALKEEEFDDVFPTPRLPILEDNSFDNKYGGESQREEDFYQEDNFVDISENASNISSGMINNFRKILSQHPDGVWASQLCQFYNDQFHASLEPLDLGHTSVISLVSSLPGVFSFRREGPHDWKLYDARHVSQKCLDDEVNQLNNLGEVNFIPQTIIDNIKKLLDENPTGFRSIDLLSKFGEKYNKSVDYEALGFKTLEDFLLCLKDEITLKPICNYYLLLPKHKLISHEAFQPPEPDERLNLPVAALGMPLPDDVMRLGEEIPLQELPPLQLDPDPEKPLLEMEVRVAEVMSPVHFFITLGDHYEDLENMMDDLEKFYHWEESKLKIPLHYVMPNLYCAVKYMDFWHRAKINRVKRNGDVEIEYIDYGTPATVKLEDLRYLSKGFTELPAQAICAKLMGVKPMNGESKFPQDVCKHFLSLVECKRLVAQVFQIAERVRYKQERVQLEVFLFDVENRDKEIVINDYLVENGYASSILDLEVQESPPEVQLPTEDLLSTGYPEYLLPQSSPVFSQENFPSSILENTSNSLPVSSKTQEEAKPVKPPPGFKGVPESYPELVDFTTLSSCVGRTGSEPGRSFSEHHHVTVNNIYTANQQPILDQEARQLVNQILLQDQLLMNQYQQNLLHQNNFSNVPFEGPPIYKSSINGKWGSIAHPPNAQYNPHLNIRSYQGFRPASHIPNESLSNAIPVSAVVPTLITHPANAFSLVNGSIPNPYLPFVQHQLLQQVPASPFPQPQQTYVQSVVVPVPVPVPTLQNYSPPVTFPRHSPSRSSHPGLSTSTRSSPAHASSPALRSSPAPVCVPITLPERPPKYSAASFTNDTSNTTNDSCSLHSPPASPEISQATKVQPISRPCTPLTPASVEVANICNLSRPNSGLGSGSVSSQNSLSVCREMILDNAASKPQSNLSLPDSSNDAIALENTPITLTDALVNTLNVLQTSESKSAFTSFKDKKIDQIFKDDLYMPSVKKSPPGPQKHLTEIPSPVDLNVNEIPLPADLNVNEIPLPPSSVEKFFSAISSPVDSLLCNSPFKEESSDDYVSAAENVDEAKRLANLTLIDQKPLTVVQPFCDSVNDIPDSWENLDLDDTPAKAANFHVDFSQPWELMISSEDKSTSVESSTDIKSATDVTEREPTLKIEAPLNWKDGFNPDILSVTKCVNNNSQEEGKCPSTTKKINVKKTPVQEIVLQGKRFHLLCLRNNTPAVIALEFFNQFSTGMSFQVAEKLIEMEDNKMYYINKVDFPDIISQLSKVSKFNGVPKEKVIRISKVKVINLSDIRHVMTVLKTPNKPLLEDFEKIANELASS